MSVFNVELVKKVDDSYDIEIGFGLMDKLVICRQDLPDLSTNLWWLRIQMLNSFMQNIYIIRYWMQDIRRISLFFRQEKKARPGLPKNL